MKSFHDSINNTQHLAFYQGEITAEEACLVRVQFANFLRELHGTNSDDNYWTAQRALKTIAQKQCGVLVILNANQSATIDDLNIDAKKPQYAYHNVGIGSQILKALNVGKMKIMGPELRFPALSGFGLEITEFIDYEH